LATSCRQQIFYHQGALLAKQGKTEEAKAALQKALASPAPYSGIEEAKKLFENLSKK
jgi:Tfp pilus assembly protein PilF